MPLPWVAFQENDSPFCSQDKQSSTTPDSAQDLHPLLVLPQTLLPNEEPLSVEASVVDQ